jgi:integrase
MSPILVRELRTGSWYLVIRHKGKKYVQKVAESKKAAEDIKRDLEKELQFRGYGALDKFKPKPRGYALTVSAYADRWISELKSSGLKPSTVDSYELQIEKHLRPHFGDLALSEVTYSRVKDFIADKLTSTYARSLKEGAAQHAYTKDSIRIMVAALRAMLEEAVRDELLESNPVHGVGRFYSGALKLRDVPDPFGLDELHRIESDSGEWLPFILFQSRTGARVGEAIALQWNDINFDQATAFIRRTMPINRKIGKPKTLSSTRTVDLSPELLTAFRTLQKSQLEYWFSQGEEIPPWVFCKHSDQAPDYSVFRRGFNRLQKRSGVRQRRVHDLRHTYASLSLQAGKSIPYVSAQLGHKNPLITLQIYTRWVPGEDSGAKDVLDSTRQQKRQQAATKEK